MALDSGSSGLVLFQDLAFTAPEWRENQFSRRPSCRELLWFRRRRMSPLLAGLFYVWLKVIYPAFVSSIHLIESRFFRLHNTVKEFHKHLHDISEMGLNYFNTHPVESS